MIFEEFWEENWLDYSGTSLFDAERLWKAAQQAERESHTVSIAEQADIICRQLEERVFFLETLHQIAWSNDSKWQADCARAAIAKATGEE